MLRVGPRTFALLLHIATLHPTMQGDSNLWSNWWSYYGISGPDYWGRVNHEWTLCSKGLYQSPVDISPRTLVYDPNLRPVRLDQHRVDGHLINTGNDITYQVDPDFNPPFLISGGPLSYTYRVHYIKLHFGRVDQIGSEHTVSGKPFPLELQFLAFNKDLYSNYSHASKSPHGVAAVAVFGMIAEAGNKEFSMFIEASSQIRYKGHNLSLSGLSIRSLFPAPRTT
ncbi:carbonic anhydrase-related protein 10-like [Pomacea canaliculata]|uniref:carbonic anhydrase-related protein 10-like n=1 Tax=Pomacea canaliculata TaxID=400727 RepID=UPI000D72A616|nr:carbonic anhydrase-related protein 10-like [Pomacea canaliculata]